MEQKIEAVIFDMYETLVTQLDSPLYFGAQIARDLGLAPEVFLPGWRATEADRTTGKLTFEAVVERLMKEYGMDSREKFQQVVEKRMALQEECFRHLHPQILPMLSGLKESGIKIGLITNCFSEEAKLIRESVLFPYFDAACLSYELGVRKPDPAIYRACVERLDIAVGNCLYVGDGGSQELEAARTFGMEAVQATWYRRENFEKYQAALRPAFAQIPEPVELLRRVRASGGLQEKS